MKKITILIAFLVAFVINTNGQINPIRNLTYSQTYQTPHTFFELNWEEPEQPHDLLIGYNIYRGKEFYRFQTERTLYNLYSQVFGFVSNCGLDFLEYNLPYEFLVHVKAVYEGQIESIFTETVTVYPPSLGSDEFYSQKAIVYPNPTKGTLNINIINLEEIIIYTIAGKELFKFSAKSQIDLSGLKKGVYILKLLSENKIITEKIVIE